MSCNHKRYELVQGFMEVATSDPEKLSQWFRKNKGFPLTVPVLDRTRFTILGGRFFSSFGIEGAHILYKESPDHRISFFVFQGKRTKFPFRKIQKEGMDFYVEEYKDYVVIFWEGEKFIYSLICKNGTYTENLMKCALMIRKK